MGNEDKIRNIANRQRGYFTTQQATDAGYSNALRNYHVANGHWLKVDRSVYRLVGYADTQESLFVRWSLWAIGRDHDRIIVVSHQSALFYYGLQEEPPAVLHLTVNRPIQRQTLPQECVLHRSDPAPGDFVRKIGYRVTTPYRTLCDLRPDLIYEARWLDTVRQAWEKELINPEEANRLLGEILYRQMLGLVPTWARPARDASTARMGSAYTESGTEQRVGLHEDTGMKADFTRMDIRHGQRQEWRVANRSFTLVEILVVVSIMCILMSLLMPALMQARGSALQLSCASNLRGIGVFCNQYSEDNNNFIVPAAKELIGLRGHWMTSVLPYFLPDGGYVTSATDRKYQVAVSQRGSVRAALFCPVSTFTPGVTFDQWCDPLTVTGALTYGLNTFNGIIGNTTENARGHRPYFGKVTRVKSPSSKFSMAEVALSAYNETMILPSCEEVSYRHGTSLPDNVQDNLKLGVSNVVYVDGHSSVVLYQNIRDFIYYTSSSKFASLGY